jgi:hypothetical protein
LVSTPEDGEPGEVIFFGFWKGSGQLLGHKGEKQESAKNYDIHDLYLIYKMEIENENI